VQILRNGGAGRAFIPDITLTLGSTIPVGFGDPHESAAMPGAGLSAGWALSGTFSLNIDGIYTYGSDGGRRYHEGMGGASFWITATETLDCYAEYFMVYPESAGGTDAHFAGAGATYLLAENFKVDLRAGLRLDRRREYYTGIGFVGRLNDLY
jgi:hypothetical protein